MVGAGGMSVSDNDEYRALLAYSARIGREPALVQAAGGNVSFKHDGVLWIKASGTWLARAESDDIMVPVDQAAILAALDGDEAEDTSRFLMRGCDGSGLRPSIETSLHSVLPHRVVVHVHCVETIAWAVGADAEAALALPLAGLAWRYVSYIRPGLPLARAMHKHAVVGTNIVVLGNHGLVVGGDTTAEAAGLVAEVQRRLARPVRPALAQPVSRAQYDGYVLAADPITHSIALDPRRFAVARRGSFYPDHVIFLGPAINERPGAPMLVQRGEGVFLRADASPAVAAMARCLADVTGRLDPGDRLMTLTPQHEAELLGWDAEKYRQALDTGAVR